VRSSTSHKDNYSYIRRVIAVKEREMRERILVAYKVWRCMFCPEVRNDSNAMWDHLIEAHSIGSVESDSTHMYSWKLKPEIIPPRETEGAKKYAAGDSV
jgi:hypothetical protein